MRLEEIMTTNVETAAPGDQAEDAWRRMRDSRIHHLAVVEGGKVVGVISGRDLGGPRSSALRTDRTVRDLMTHRTVSAKPTTTLRQAANLMRGYSVGCLPVLDGGRLRGIVTVSDLLELLGRGVERPVETTQRKTLKDRGPRRRPGAPR